MLITMTQHRRGSEDGFAVRKYLKDEIYDVADSLAREFIRQGWAAKAEIKEGTPV